MSQGSRTQESQNRCPSFQTARFKFPDLSQNICRAPKARACDKSFQILFPHPGSRAPDLLATGLQTPGLQTRVKVCYTVGHPIGCHRLPKVPNRMSQAATGWKTFRHSPEVKTFPKPLIFNHLATSWGPHYSQVAVCARSPALEDLQSKSCDVQPLGQIMRFPTAFRDPTIESSRFSRRISVAEAAACKQ